MPETLSASALVKQTLETMEDDLRISPKQAKDFIASAEAVIGEHLDDGKKIQLFGFATLTPFFVKARKAGKGRNPRTGEEVDVEAKPAKVWIRAGATKKIKDMLPDATSKAGKALKSEAKAKEEARAERAAQREAEEAKAARKAERDKKSKSKKGK